MYKNKKWMKLTALVVVIVMSVLMLASCQSGRTYEDPAGDESAVTVTEKEQQPVIEYTGDPIINLIPTDDPAYADVTISGGDTNNGGNEDDENSDPGSSDENTDPSGDEGEATEPSGDEDISDDEEKPTVTYEEGNKLVIVDYNLRVGNDGPNKNIKDRAPRFKDLMDRKDPDIMGLQEVNQEWLTYLDQNFSAEYEYIYEWRHESSKETTPLFWKKDKFEALETGHFWMSDSPNEATKGWGADHYRICMWAKLKVKATGKVFLFYNTHLDFNDEAHVGSINLFLKTARAKGGFSQYGVLFTADCNMRPWGKGYNAMLETVEMSDVNLDLDEDKTPTGNGYNESSGGSIIDFCFYSLNLIAPLEYEVLNEKIMDGYISDHRGLYIEVALL